jgi:hypothetical protein
LLGFARTVRRGLSDLFYLDLDLVAPLGRGTERESSTRREFSIGRMENLRRVSSCD